ncbi:hypothetical protein Tco_1123600 [Tanacetum coccineum]|uniref:Reverse transcriptase domain-containing protein n=1 Tax=Tanacetum coccineum TaxID=301880 RepID=A0ABQ5J3U2_9ASTR
MPRIKREGHYLCNVRVEYEWKPPRCTSCKVFGYIHKECPKNTGAGEKKNLKKTSQTSRGVPVGLKMGFKPHKEYRPVLKKLNASSSGNKKKGVEPSIEVLFDVLNSVDNDAELVLLLLIKIGKFKDLLSSGQAILVDNAGNPLKKVEFLGDYDSKDEVTSIDNDMACSLALERVGFGTQSLLEQWRDLYGNGDYDEDPYDEDIYEGHDVTQEIQAICDNLDIRVRDSHILDCPLTIEEIKEAVWNFSISKAPAFALVLVNGSSTKEFKIKRGLHQGDSLSPFLFILAVEALNVGLLEASNINIFKGIKVGKDSIHVSHLHFTDDALILGEWLRSNAMNLLRILTCFHLSSGLKGLVFIAAELSRYAISVEVDMAYWSFLGVRTTPVIFQNVL